MVMEEMIFKKEKCLPTALFLRYSLSNAVMYNEIRLKLYSANRFKPYFKV